MAGFYDKTGKREPNRSLSVTLQDQHTPVLIMHMSILKNTTTTTGAIAIDDIVIPVASVTGITPGRMLVIFDPNLVRYTMFHIISVTDLNVTIDTPADFAFPAGSYVDISDINLNVDGSTTPIIAGVRNNSGSVPPPGLELTVDITRIIISCTASSAVSFDLFGNIAALTRGLVLRKRDGTYNNIFNVKTNGEFAGIMFDFTTYAATNPQQGVDGFVCRLTFSGQDKMGVTERLAINEDLELIIQDDLTGLSSFTVVAEGSVVLP